MSSFVNAAPFNNQESSNSLEQRRKTRNLTLKKPPPKKVSINSTLHAIHSNSMDDNNFMENFTPPRAPASSIPPKLQEGNHCNGNDEKTDNFIQEGFFSQDEQASEYPSKYEEKPMSKMEQHKQFLNVIKNSVNTSPSSINSQLSCPEHYNSFSNEQKELFDKINYMIQLLETQKSEKTEGVIEDVVLYSFLGIFVIFLVESFTKVGKYVR